MSLRIATLATEAEDGRLAGLEGRFAWGKATTLPLADRATAVFANLEVILERLPDDGGQLLLGRGGGNRVVATTGEGLWRRMPWAANDRLFAMSDADPRHGALVVGGSPASRAELVAKLTDTDVAVRAAPHLTADDLETCAIVIYPPRTAALPVDAMAVLAARRLLVTGLCSPAFGLRAGFTHLEAGFADHAVVNVAAALSHWDTFSTLRIWGALAAERHRASVVLPRLARDLLQETQSG